MTLKIVYSNILTLVSKYDKVDFIIINGQLEEGICEMQTYTSDTDPADIEAYLEQVQSEGISRPHLMNSMPAAIQKYLFGNYGDEYISEENLIDGHDPTAIYVSLDMIYLAYPDGSYGHNPYWDDTYPWFVRWGIEYGTEKFFNFISERYGNRYFSMSQSSQDSDSVELYIHMNDPGDSVFDEDVMNLLIGLLNPDLYGEAANVLSAEDMEYWANYSIEDKTAYYADLTFEIADKKYAADYISNI